MALTPDITLSQVHDKCVNPEVKAYIASMQSLPIDISLCEFLAILLQAAAVAQVAANNENTNAKAV
ncbi:MAG: hypothetical protein V7L11_17695 [Nostoc sp.]|uniref:hypothetical protein n=1 Tax=Nostoc sp. TaxID=1180 RepID=UPI002FFB4809